MDFIERFFGMSPDGGDGSLEMVWLAAIAVAFVLILFRRRVLGWLNLRAKRNSD